VAACAAVVAAGQRQDRSLLPDSLAGVFLAGDLATGPASVVEAIASGREAALAADRHLGGAGELSLRLGPSFAPAGLGRVEGFTSLPRLEPEPPPEEHRSSLDTAAPGLGAERAREEADRCLRCDLRLLYHRPPTPPARQERLALSEESLALVPEGDGVVCFYDQAGEILEIVGGSDMRAEVEERLDAGPEVLFDFEPHPMFTQRQNELLSRYMESHGKMPPGVREEDDLDDLF